MSADKSAIIVTDGSEKVKKMADCVLKALGGIKTLVMDAHEFAGTDLLPANIVFIGCEKPSPSSFAYLEKLLQHINLAGRKCGVFSPSSKEAVQYMTKMVKDSDITLNPAALFEANSTLAGEWTAKTISGK